MAAWFVYEPPDSQPGSLDAANRDVFIKDAWSWGAFLFTPLWLLWRRMWLVFLGWLAAMLALALAAAALKGGGDVVGTLGFLLALWFGLEGNALRRMTLDRKGWRFAGLATGADRIDAEYRFFERRAAAPQPAAPAGEARPLLRRGPNEVLGVFPEPLGNGR